jgi:hypothetical protein
MMRPVPELVCQCGITFEPLPCYDADNDEPLCDECADVVGNCSQPRREQTSRFFLGRSATPLQSGAISPCGT